LCLLRDWIEDINFRLVRGNVRTLVISDIHGNWPALRSVIQRPFDAVIVLGDLVGYGPFPAECVNWARDNANIVIQGNHDRAYADNIPAGCRPSFRWLSDAVGPLTWRQLRDDQLAYLRALPRWAILEIDDRQYAFVHAAPTSPLYEYIGPDPRRWKAELRGLSADVLIVGHTHLQFALPIGEREVINPGSVGQPKDGDPRAAFLIIENGHCTLERVEYPVDETVAGLVAADVDPAARSVLSILLRTGEIPEVATGARRDMRAESDDWPPPRVRGAGAREIGRDTSWTALEGDVEDMGLSP
jgi:putative phosphoesterase